MSEFRFMSPSRSSGSGECVEVATNLLVTVGVRDSKNPAGPHLRLSASAWAAFVDEIRGRRP